MPRRRVLVIGAGMSGLSCACELQHRGYDVLVVEARNRVGGRLKGGDLLLSDGSIQHVDLGGALIHGIEANPAAELVEKITTAVKPVSDCLLLDDSGWPVDPKEDERVSAVFNECLEEAFRRAKAIDDDNANVSFGNVFTAVCEEQKVVNSTPLLRWHKSNLEVSCGTSFENLGLKWNDDEPFGFDGAHVALSTSWKTVVDTLAKGLDIMYDTPVQSIHIVYAKKEDRATTTARTTSTVKRPVVASSTLLTERKRRPVNEVITQTRQSRRLRGEDAHARRSMRERKGQGVDRFTVEHEEKSPPRKKRQRPEGPKHTIVQVTLRNGTVLEADAVVCTLPLGILQSNEVTFVPPLTVEKSTAIQRLGTGLLNKCALSFSHVFWQDSDFLGLADLKYSYLVLNVASYTGKPVLMFMYGGSFAAEIEDWTDVEVVNDCLDVLRIICGRKIPEPIDYQVTRWGKENYSRVAFTYVPPGVDGFQELRALGKPVLDNDDKTPVLMFAGEHTSAYHPSTIHGALLSGIREACRLDLTLEPEANNNISFKEDEIYQPTYPIDADKNAQAPPPPPQSMSRSVSAETIRKSHRRRGASNVVNTNVPKPQDVTSQQRPTRRSLRSQVTLKKNESGAAKTLYVDNNNNNSINNHTSSNSTTVAAATDNNNKDNGSEDLQDRTMLRNLDSYSADYSFMQAFTLPVYGGSSRLTTQQIHNKCRQLLAREKKQKLLPQSSSAYKSWIAKQVYDNGIPKDKQVTNKRPVASPGTRKSQRLSNSSPSK